ncbi:MAG: hypothetical protein OSA45_05185 [Halioglobus sp.]|nr:hypothetical protein [Halioglobus sp.]
MDFLTATIALLLPVLLGGLWLSLFVPRGIVARRALVWGNGALIGLMLIPQIMRAQDAVGLPLNFSFTYSIVCTLVVLALIARVVITRNSQVEYTKPRAFAAMPPLHRLLFVVFLLMILLRVATLGLEILWRPLFPWDATMHWATKARVWFEFQEMVPFVDNFTWLNSPGEDVFTDRHPGYPAAIPLLQVWMNLAIGRWNESLMNLPWVLCLLALGTALYGQLRFAGVNPLLAIVATYLLQSMPLINTHVALAGYADLFLGAAYCGALMAFQSWVTTQQRWQGFLVILFAVLCSTIKSEGFVWALTLIPALAVALMTRRQAAKLFALVTVILVLLLILVSKDTVIAGYTIEGLAPSLHIAGLVGTVKVIWLHDNWHLFGYLLLAIIPLGLLLPGTMTKKFLGLSLALGIAAGSYIYLFLFTGFGWGASNFAAVGRLGIQIVPGLLFLCVLIFNEYLDRRELQSSAEATESFV